MSEPINTSEKPRKPMALTVILVFAIVAAAGSMALLVKWLLLCLGKLWMDVASITAMALREHVRVLEHTYFIKSTCAMTRLGHSPVS